MTSYVYNLALHIYAIILRIAALFNSRAREWIEGRWDNLDSLKSFRREHKDKVIWFHCASLGEFEQALPLIQKIRKNKPDFLLAATFYSPSGYKYQKSNAVLDWVGYLPHDYKKTMTEFIDVMKPYQVIIVKNEWWWNLLTILKEREIETIFIAVSVTPQTYFIKYAFPFFRKSLDGISKIFSVNEKSKNLLKSLTFTPIIVAGDTKYDRVHDNKETPYKDTIIEQYLPCIIYGSVWEKDISILAPFINDDKRYNHLLFPHNIDESSINSIAKHVDDFDLYSSWTMKNSNMLIIDSIGILKYAYRYATKAYVGGGFGDGIHNVLEPIIYDIPVSCANNISGVHEIDELIKKNLLTIISNAEDFENFIADAREDRKSITVKERATDIIYDEIYNP